jgi:hypothetical protein
LRGFWLSEQALCVAAEVKCGFFGVANEPLLGIVYIHAWLPGLSCPGRAENHAMKKLAIGKDRKIIASKT